MASENMILGMFAAVSFAAFLITLTIAHNLAFQLHQLRSANVLTADSGPHEEQASRS